MASQVTNYQCPNCTGPLQFAPQSGKLVCEYCGQEFDTAEIEALYARKDADAQAEKAEADRQWEKAVEEMGSGAPWVEGEAENLRVYNCPSCGAEIICDTNTAATSCVYCGNPSIVPGQLGGALKPDFVIPFKKTKEDAVAALKNFYKGKRLLPGAFTKGNHLEEIKGLYVPFWLFDGRAEGAASYNATTVRSWNEGSYRVTETNHYFVRRGGSLTFQKIPVDGSSSMSDDLMDSIEPYDYNELQPFTTAVLPGFLADKYDVDAKAGAPRAAERAKQSLLNAMRASVEGYATVAERESSARFLPSRTSYAMMPVWLLHTKWQDKDYYFAMNGQTGKLIGDLPISKGRFFAWFFGIWSGVTLLLQIVSRLL